MPTRHCRKIKAQVSQTSYCDCTKRITRDCSNKLSFTWKAEICNKLFPMSFNQIISFSIFFIMNLSQTWSSFRVWKMEIFLFQLTFKTSPKTSFSGIKIFNLVCMLIKIRCDRPRPWYRRSRIFIINSIWHKLRSLIVCVYKSKGILLLKCKFKITNIC